MSKKVFVSLSKCLLILICILLVSAGCTAQKKPVKEEKSELKKTEVKAVKKTASKKSFAKKKIVTPSGYRAASIPQTISDIKDVAPTIAQILKGKERVEDKVCQVSSDRKDIKVTIMGRKTSSIGHEFSFEMIDNSKALCLGELALQEKEVDMVMRSLLQQGITVTAVHNHWLLDSPKLIYMHSESIMNPVEYATKVANVLSKL